MSFIVYKYKEIKNQKKNKKFIKISKKKNNLKNKKIKK